MQDSIQSTLRLICAEQHDAGEHVQPPADSADIQALRTYASERHSVELAEPYTEILSKVDGMDFNGCVIYATAQRPIPGVGVLLGFRETNEAFERGSVPYYVLYGETGDDLFVQERGGTWHVLDKASLSVLESFTSQAALFERVLSRALST